MIRLGRPQMVTRKTRLAWKEERLEEFTGAILENGVCRRRTNGFNSFTKNLELMHTRYASKRIEWTGHRSNGIIKKAFEGKVDGISAHRE